MSLSRAQLTAVGRVVGLLQSPTDFSGKDINGSVLISSDSVALCICQLLSFVLFYWET